AIGDPEANRVTIYSYDDLKGNWSRTREIYPPKNSVINKVGNGFGYSLALNQNQLIIGAYSEPKPSYFDDSDEMQNNEFANNYHGAVYSLLLGKDYDNPLKEIAMPQPKMLAGYAVTMFNNKIALGTGTEIASNTRTGQILIVNPTTLQIETTISPPNSEKKFADFGLVIDGNNKSLLIGSRGLSRRGGALLVDQAGKIEEISSVRDPIHLSLIAGSSVALTNDLIAVGSSAYGGDGNTMLLRRTMKKRSLPEVIPFGGSLDATGSYVLVSTGKEIGMPTLTFQLIHMLVKLEHNRVKIVSKIRWQWNPDVKFKAKGIIHNDQLLLSHKGKAVLLSMKYLPRNYVINRSFCKVK
ncbi:MAG: hypothetical protein ACRC80_22210, partial [Waterburya sp.]